MKRVNGNKKKMTTHIASKNPLIELAHAMYLTNLLRFKLTLSQFKHKQKIEGFYNDVVFCTMSLKFWANSGYN